MPRYRRTRYVQMSPDRLWRAFLATVAHPAHYVDGLVSTRVVKEHEDGLTRILQSETGHLAERIRLRPHDNEVVFQLVGHPIYRGDYIHRAEPAKEGSSLLVVELDWIRHDGAPDDVDFRDLLDSALDHLEAVAEALPGHALVPTA